METIEECDGSRRIAEVGRENNSVSFNDGLSTGGVIGQCIGVPENSSSTSVLCAELCKIRQLNKFKLFFNDGV